MAYDTELADRIRFLIGAAPGVTEKKMFGGLAFMVSAIWRSEPAAAAVPWSGSTRRHRRPAGYGECHLGGNGQPHDAGMAAGQR
jgi:hypothetical protein